MSVEASVRVFQDEKVDQLTSIFPLDKIWMITFLLHKWTTDNARISLLAHLTNGALKDTNHGFDAQLAAYANLGRAP